MKNNNFRLSAAGKLAAALAIILAASAGAYAAEIVAANGANGPGVSTAATGAQVVDIVAPNGNGLSHNQYQDFNVNRPLLYNAPFERVQDYFVLFQNEDGVLNIH